MKSRDKFRTQTLRSLKSAIRYAEIEVNTELDDQALLAVIAKQAKQRQESIVEYRKGGREDLVAEEEAELAILQTYLPQQLTREEIEVEARQVIDEVGASNPRDIGKVMKPLMARLKGRADGRLVNQVVRELLAG